MPCAESFNSDPLFHSLNLLQSVIRSEKKGVMHIAKEKPSSFDKADYDRKYARDNLVQFRIALNKHHDQDIISKLNEVPNKTGYVKKLIRDDLKRDGDHEDPSGQ